MGRKTARNTKDGTVFVKDKKRKNSYPHVFSYNKKRPPTRARFIILSIVVIICTLQAIEIWIKNELSVKDFEYKILLVQISDQEKENSLLNQEVLEIESFTKIYQAAINEGFVPVTYVYLH